MNAHESLKLFSSILSDVSLVDCARIISSTFVRDRKIDLNKLLNYLIFRGKNVLSQDLCHFFSAIDNFKIPTRQAMIKRMNILNFDISDGHNSDILNEISISIGASSNKRKDKILKIWNKVKEGVSAEDIRHFCAIINKYELELYNSEENDKVISQWANH